MKTSWVLARIGAVALLTFLAAPALAAKLVNISKWQRLELTFTSEVNYVQPLDDAEMRVIFVSPLGETNRVYGFWDGDRTWRVRFRPDFPGRWTYFTLCSNTADRGLHGVAGEFLCTAAEDTTGLHQRGPIRPARNGKYLEHADLTPFLWRGDAAWAAGTRTTQAEWKNYVTTRAKQKFNVIQVRLNPPANAPERPVFTGWSDQPVNLEIARAWDEKIATANRAGLVCAIAPFWEFNSEEGNLPPETNAIAMMRYAVARWDADKVVWIAAFETDSQGGTATRWQNIGRAVFPPVNHAPVVVFPGESVWALDAFRSEPWVAALGVQTTSAVNESSLPWLLQGPLGQERHKRPARPLLTLNPPGESWAPGESTAAVTDETARRLLWWSLLRNTPAGVSYAAQEAAQWPTNSPADATRWKSVLGLPGATSMAGLFQVLGTRDYWQLQPVTLDPAAVTNAAAVAPGAVAAMTVDRSWSVVFVPDRQPLKLSGSFLPGKSRLKWVNAITGEERPAKATMSGSAPTLTPPNEEDWILLATSSAENPPPNQPPKP
jgi:hypothetical protein